MIEKNLEKTTQGEKEKNEQKQKYFTHGDSITEVLKKFALASFYQHTIVGHGILYKPFTFLHVLQGRHPSLFQATCQGYLYTVNSFGTYVFFLEQKGMLTAHYKRFGFPRLRVLLLFNIPCLQVSPGSLYFTIGKRGLKEPLQENYKILSTALAIIKSFVSDQKFHVFCPHP